MTGTAASILVVDDEKLIRWSVSERLTRNGFNAASAETGEQALEMILASPPDVMLLDVRLPGIDGLETLRRALTLSPELVVVMMSAHSSVDVAVDAMKQGAVDFLVKPFPLQALDAAVRRALDASATRKQIARAAVDGQEGPGSTGIIGNSAAIAQVREMASRLAESNATTVLIEGDSGVGKEVVARFIHGQSSRAARPFLQLNCAALPEHLIESELFGHERGAFTDARSQKTGLFESAEGGSVLLDEIGDLPPSGQAKLLLLLENKTVRRVGGNTEFKVDVRVIAATNVHLEERVSQGRFRADLFFRLNVVSIRVPPLRERKEDVLELAAFFVARYNQEMKRSVKGISSQALDLLVAYPWPGNVRELRNVVERAFILHLGVDEIRPEHLPEALREAQLAASASPLAVPVPKEGSMALEEVEKRMIAEAMERARGNQSQAARVLGISRDTLRYRLKKHGIA